MARYEYECMNCGYVSEHSHGGNMTLRNAKCPRCGEWARVKKLLSRCTFILKGRGWAKDKYEGEKSCIKK